MGYLGGESAIYRLTLAAAPWVTSLYPSGGWRGTKVPVTVSQAQPPRTGATPTPSTVHLELSPTAERVLTVAPLPEMANARPFVAGDLPETLEAELDDTPVQANRVTLPLVFNGRIEHPGDVELPHRAGERGEHRRRCPGREGAAVAGWTWPSRSSRRTARSWPRTTTALHLRGDGEPPGQPQRLPTPGVHRACGRRLSSASATLATAADRMASTAPPSRTVRRAFRSRRWTDNPQIKGPGATGVILTQLQRYGSYAGAVRVRIGGLPPGWTSSEAIFAPATPPVGDGVVLTLTAPPDARPGTVAPFWIEGEALVDGQPLTVRATTIAHVTRTATTGSCARARAVSPASSHRKISVSAPRRAPSAAQAGESVPIPVTIERDAAYTGDVIYWRCGQPGPEWVYALGLAGDGAAKRRHVRVSPGHSQRTQTR